MPHCMVFVEGDKGDNMKYFRDDHTFPWYTSSQTNVEDPLRCPPMCGDDQL